MKLSIQKSIVIFLITITTLFISACNLKGVSPDTLSATQSYADFQGVSVKVGAQAPEFSLPDAKKTSVSLSGYRNKQAVMLLFYRGDWCPYCVDQLTDYQTLLPELEKYNIQLIAISPDKLASVENTQRKFGQSYVFLSDKDLKVTRQYGIGNQKNLPHPALFLINKQGELVWYYASKDHKTRPSSAQVEAIIQALFSN